MKELKVIGKELDPGNETVLPPLEDEEFELVQVIQVSKSRAVGDVIKLKVEEEDDIIDALFEDGTEWIGSAADFEEIFSEVELTYSRSMDEGLLPSGVFDASERGLGSFFKAINIFRKKKDMISLVGRELGEWLDKKIAPVTGLFRLTRDFQMEPFPGHDNSGNSYFVFIHGTISNTENSFHKLRDNDTTGAWDAIHDRFGSRVLALEHYTVSESPLQNAVVLLQALPDNVELTIMSGSRGGLIGDFIAKCDHRNPEPGFRKAEIEFLQKKDPTEADLARTLNQLVEKKITVERFIRVACPGAGTEILSARADHFLNALLRVVGLVFGGTLNQIYGFIRRFILKVIRSRTTPGVMPGLLAMIPGSHLIQVLNHPLSEGPDELFIVEGNARFGKLGQTLLVILTRLYFLEQNDFVVNTDSMRLGLRRAKGFLWFRSEDGKTHHLNYFKNPNSQRAIKAVVENAPEAINSTFSIQAPQSARGVLFEVFQIRDEECRIATGNRPICVLLPGIMGSHLYADVDRIWLDFGSIVKGKIRELRIENKMAAKSIVGNYYSELVKYLEKTYDVQCFPYDWRKSLSESALELKALLDKLLVHKQEIRIIAHSMGGLVTRTLMVKDPDFWNKYMQREGSRLVMLGTPWYGSYGTLEVLSGRSGRVNQLALLDLLHTRQDLLQVFMQFPGIFEMLPIESKRSFESIDYWKNLKNEFSDITVPDEDMLAFFAQVKEDVNKTDFDFENVYYIAGHSGGTTFDYRARQSIFSKKKSLQFLKTPNGDGTVTWESGIPSGLPRTNLYYTRTQHGQLADDPEIFRGIYEVLSQGRTNQFLESPPASRGQAVTVAPELGSKVSNDPKEILDRLYGIEPVEVLDQEKVEITVSLSLGHLRHAYFPVLVGHFIHDGMVSAESALDYHLRGKLSERHQMNLYPGEIKESEVLLVPDNRPPGAVVIGLGSSTDLTAFKLATTIEFGILKYVMFLRDQNTSFTGSGEPVGISSLLIGSGFGRLSVEESLSAIIRGIDRANEVISSSDSQLRPVSRVEFIELYDNSCRAAYYALKNIVSRERRLNLKLVTEVEIKGGSRKRLEYAEGESWWDEVSVSYKMGQGFENGRGVLEFTLSSGLARIQKQKLFPSVALVDNLLIGFAPKTKWLPQRAKTLFEILIPRDFKSILRNQHNVLWKVDSDTANYPWEMLHDYTVDEEPAFVRAGMIRQYITEEYRPNPLVIKENSALVIGDPLYTDMDEFMQLEGALQEADTVAGLLDKKGFAVQYLSRAEGIDILDNVVQSDYKILHISGHGIYDPDNNRIGPVLGSGMFLDPEILKNLDQVPEFVFINCCYSGEVGSAMAWKDRPRLAANIGVTLIEMGVHAIVVAGWEVADQAARVFAEELYHLMLAGNYFGEAVRKARRKCYQEFPHNNTWGAYQCYGNQWYKLIRESAQADSDSTYIANEEVEVDLYNLKSRALDQRRDSKPYLLEDLNKIMDKAYRSNMINGAILELEADIYSLLDEVESAMDRYQILFDSPASQYSVRAIQGYCNNLLKSTYFIKDLDDEKIESILWQIESKSAVVDSVTRNLILGGAYKAFAAASEEHRILYLQKMFTCYSDLYGLSATDLRLNTLSLCNSVLAHHLLGSKSSGTLAGEKIDQIQLVDRIRKRVEAEGGSLSNRDRKYLDLQIDLLELLTIDRDTYDMELITRDFLQKYQEIWTLGGTLQDLRDEINDLGFITNVSTRKIKKEIKELVAEILRYLNEQ